MAASPGRRRLQLLARGDGGVGDRPASAGASFGGKAERATATLSGLSLSPFGSETDSRVFRRSASASRLASLLTGGCFASPSVQGQADDAQSLPASSEADVPASCRSPDGADRDDNSGVPGFLSGADGAVFVAAMGPRSSSCSPPKLSATAAAACAAAHCSSTSDEQAALGMKPLSRRSIGGESDLWHDATSSFDTAEDADQRHIDAIIGGLHVPSSAGPHVPCPPLLMAEREYVFVPVPEKTGFAGYWLRDPSRSSPQPLPIDVLLGVGRFMQRAHESVPGIWFKESASTLSLTAKPRSIPLGPWSRYVEAFAKDGSVTPLTLRRDTRVGRSSGQVFFTECGTLILRVCCKGLFCDEPDTVFEDYITLSEDGSTIFTRQACYHHPTQRMTQQLLVGDRIGDVPPIGHM